ncbi:MAG: Cys-Xaa-Xaa-Xaa repeat radical SAM target protein [Muribaculaceae bacterium]|nr:Cys-Xaa-Xaa-Xaa repeat radical SAM target protein [Muribaculaceae bacterium]
MKQNKNEELQSRRQFFKKAAKSALPVLGAIALANIPMIANASISESGYCTCSGNCSGSCSGSCVSSCRASCGNSCKGTCSYTCDHGCSGSCNGR